MIRVVQRIRGDDEQGIGVAGITDPVAVAVVLGGVVGQATVILRAADPVAVLVGALEAYVSTDHTPDEIMALWFALEGARRLIARRKDAEEGDGVGAYILG